MTLTGLGTCSPRTLCPASGPLHDLSVLLRPCLPEMPPRPTPSPQYPRSIQGVLRHFEVLKVMLREGEHQTDDEEEPDVLEGWGSTNHFDHNTRSAMPLVLHHRVHEVRGLRKMHSTVIFYINTGLLTCVDPAAGRVLWQVETDSVFRGHSEHEGATETLEHGDMSLRGSTTHDRTRYPHYPHLVPFAVPASHSRNPSSKVGSIRSVATTKDKPYVLVVGDNVLTAVKSDTGKIEEEIDLDEAVIAPLVRPLPHPEQTSPAILHRNISIQTLQNCNPTFCTPPHHPRVAERWRSTPSPSF